MSTAFSRSLWYKDTGDSNRLKLLTGKTNVKLQPNGSSYPTGAILLSETGVASGIYKNDTVPDGLYKIYIDDVYRSEFGIFYIADGDISIYALLAGGNTFSGNQLFEDNVHVEGQIDVDTSVVALELFVDVDGAPYTTNTPSFNTSLIWKGYLDARIAAINLSPYQESSNFRRCIPNGTTETNKVYTTIRDAAGSFASPSANNNCMVQISGTGAISKYITAKSNACVDYVNYKGVGRHINIIFSDGATNSKICTFENCTLFFGANDFAAARNMSNKTYINCTIYAYKDTTFTGCTLINCRIIHSSTYKAYLVGTTTAENCFFNNEYDKTGLTTGYVAGCFGIDITTLPTDPSVAGGSEE